MKEIRKQGAQGDVLFRRVAYLPDGLVEAKSLVVAHSETGHNHEVAPQPGVKLKLYDVPDDPLRSYLVLGRGTSYADVVHKRGWDTHEALRLINESPGEGEVIFEVRRQREHTPAGWRPALD